MYPLINSIMFWVMVAVATASIFVINMTFRALLNRRAEEQDRYAHRVGTQLPRTLHQGDHDEVIDIVHGNTATSQRR